MAKVWKAYHFGAGKADGNAEKKNLLGGKGANLAEMATLGINVPPGFTLPTTWSASVLAEESTPSLKGYLDGAMEDLSDRIGTDFLYSVRSGARVSMPGMMDTILNVGINRDNVGHWGDILGPETATDCLRRFIEMYSETALGVPRQVFKLTAEKVLQFPYTPTKWDIDRTMKYCHKLAQIVGGQTGCYFVDDYDYLLGAAKAVIESWGSPRAVKYREQYGIPHDWGTAVTVQKMVFGNMGETSGTGVVFSRCPNTGEDTAVGEFLLNAQGEDVVAGTATPLPIEELATVLPETFNELMDCLGELEKHYKEMQDVEFTVEDGELYILQTRDGKRSAKAAMVIARALINEFGVDPIKAMKNVPNDLSSQLDGYAFKDSPGKETMKGLGASGGLYTGVAVKTLQQADMVLADGKNPIFVAEETTPDDIEMMIKCGAFLTNTGGMTSHAAVVARGMGKHCVVGCSQLDVNEVVSCPVTIDGASGRVWLGSFELEYLNGESQALDFLHEMGFTPSKAEGISVYDGNGPLPTGGVYVVSSDPTAGDFEWEKGALREMLSYTAGPSLADIVKQASKSASKIYVSASGYPEVKMYDVTPVVEAEKVSDLKGVVAISPHFVKDVLGGTDVLDSLKTVFGFTPIVMDGQQLCPIAKCLKELKES